MKKTIFILSLFLFSCSTQNKCINYNAFYLSKDEYSIINLKITNTEKTKGAEQKIALITSDKNYKKIGEFQVAKFINTKEYILPDGYRMLVHPNINPVKYFKFNELVNKTIRNSHIKAIETGKKFNADAVLYFGSKTNPRVKYRKNKFLSEFNHGCDTYVFSKYFIMVLDN